MKKSFKSLIIVLIIVMCLGVFVGCSTYKIRDDYHYETMTIYFKDGENISTRKTTAVMCTKKKISEK